MRIVDWSLDFYRLPYVREVVWANAIEDAGVFALLRLASDEGAIGIAEGTIKATWSGVSPRSLAAAVEDLVLPLARGIDIDNASDLAAALAKLPENRLAKALVDNACWTARSARAGQPLWRMWAGQQRVTVSWTVTRQAPALMAKEAAEAVERYGFRTLKVKGGQGVATDLAALREIRSAVGPSTVLYVDANSAYPRAEAIDYLRAIGDAGATVAEDPCPLAPNRAFTDLQDTTRLPILVDSSCVSAHDAALFVESGARALSAKPGRVGLSEARAISSIVTARGGGVAVGLYAESALGTLISLQLDAALAPSQRVAAAEQSFFLSMCEQVLREPLMIHDGCIDLPDSGDWVSLVDWERVKRNAI